MLNLFRFSTLLILGASSAWSSEQNASTDMGTCQIKALVRSGSVQVNTLSLPRDECLWVAFLQAKGNFMEFKAGTVAFLVRGVKTLDAEIRFSPRVSNEHTCLVTSEMAENNSAQQITSKKSMRNCLESALQAFDQHPSLGHQIRIDYSDYGTTNHIVLSPQPLSSPETRFSDN